MTEKEVERLEQRLATISNALDSHIEILGYYFAHSTIGTNPKQMNHMLWIIQHHPESEVAGSTLCMPLPIVEPDNTEAVKKAWQEQIAKHPDKAAVLGNAGEFFSVLRDRSAPNLLIKAHFIEPLNPNWLTALGQYYKFEIRGNQERGEQISADRENAIKAFNFYNSALKLTKNIEGRISILSNLALLAFTAGKAADARNDGILLLTMAKQYPKEGMLNSAVSIGHMVLGELYLKDGHLEQAKQQLMMSADIVKVISDKILPDMSLSRQLLQADQKQVVVEFLTRCKRFCKRTELDDWISEINRGLTPDFDSSPF